MPSIAELFVTVSSDVSGAITGLTDVDKKVNGTAAAMTAAAPAGFALAGAAAAVGAGFLSSIDVASDFEAQMNGIRSVMSPTEVLEFGGAIEELALRLGKDTVFSSSEAANAIEELIKAGVPLPDIMNGAAAAALDLASATGIDTAQAATFAATAMNTFHLAASELPGIMDTIANTANGTAADVGGLQLGMSQAGTVAASLGLSFEDTALALGLFANNGLKGSDAGTSLKTMLAELQPDTAKTKALMMELGIVTADGANAFFTAEGKAKSYGEIGQVLQTALMGMSDAQASATLRTLFGSDAVRAATILAKEGAAGWDEVTVAVDKMGGVQVAAAQRNAGLEGSMNQLGGSIEAIQITIGSLFLPVLTSMVQMLTGAANAFLTLDPSIQTAIIAAVGIAGAVAGITAAFILLTPVLSAAAGAFGVLTLAASPFLVPILAITAAVGLLYIAWQTNFGGIQEVTAATWAALQPAFENIGNFLGQLKDALAPAFTAVGNALAPIGESLSSWAGEWLAMIPPAIKAAGDFFNSLSAIFQLLTSGDFQGGIFGLQEDDAIILFLLDLRTTLINVWNSLQPLIAAIGDLWNAFTQGGDVGAALGNLWTAVEGVLSNIGKAAIDAVGALVSGLLGSIGNLAPSVGDALGGLPGLMQGPISIAQNLFGGLVEAIRQSCVIAGGLFNGLVDLLGNLAGPLGAAWENIKTFIAGLLAQIPGVIAGAGDIWGGFVIGAWNIGTRLGEAFANFIGFIRNTFEGIPGLIASLNPGEFFKPFIDAAWNIGTEIGKAFGNFLTYIGQSFDGIAGMIEGLNPGEFFKPFIDAAWNIGTEIGKAFGNFLTYIGQSFSGIGDMIAGLNPGEFFKAFTDAAWEIGTEIGKAIGNVLGYIGQALSGIPELIAGLNPGEFFKAVVDAAWNIGTELGKAIQNILDYIWTALGSIPQLILDLGDVFGNIISAAGALKDRLGEILGPVVQVVKDIFGMVPAWFSNVFGGGGTAPVPPTGGGTPGAGSPYVYINAVNVGSQAEADSFFEQMSVYIEEAARRVATTYTAAPA